MRRDYQDPDRHFNHHMQQAAERYVDGLEKAGLEPNDTLTRAMAERAYTAAKADYLQNSQETHRHNLNAIMREHTRRMNQAKREGARLRLWTCPPIAALFLFMAWLSFSQAKPESLIMTIIYIVGALTFLGMLIFGAIFDQPTKE